MNRRDVPSPVLGKLTELSDAAELLSAKVTEIEQGISSARQRLTGGFNKEAEYRDLRAALAQMVDDLPALKEKLHAAQYTRSACKAWYRPTRRSR
jgi:hypothetical protein